jgi:hypothetical protein
MAFTHSLSLSLSLSIKTLLFRFILIKLQKMPQESTRRVISRNVNKTDEILSTDNKQGSSKHHQNEDKSTDLTSFTNKTPYNEDIELEETNIDQNYIWKELVTDKFRNVLESIKVIQNAPLMDKYELDQNYKKGLLMCATLKKLNRVSHLRINKARIKSNEEKNKVDEHHLELQNLLYEISHIQKEVNKCLEFRYIYVSSSISQLISSLISLQDHSMKTLIWYRLMNSINMHQMKYLNRLDLFN